MAGVEPLRSEVPSAKVLSLLWVVNLTFQYKVNKIHPKVFQIGKQELFTEEFMCGQG